MPSGLFEVEVERNVLIQMPDGVALAGNLYRPIGADPGPVLVSYYPYHKDGVIGSRLDHPNRYFAERGYASLIVDFRGLGSSEGTRWEHMDPREGSDGAALVEWVASQPWCDGNVGMWGMSYGGASTLYAASNRPPHLKAVVVVAGDVDIYHEINYPGGCLIGGAVLGNWGPWMVAMGLLPPLYQDPEGRWQRLWFERLRRADPPHVFPLQEHPDYDATWQERTVPVEQIDCPIFLIGAWRDQNPDAMLGTFAKVRAPRKVLIGPWMHSFPDLAPFDPVDYLAEMMRWWDVWLRGRTGKIVEEPPVTFYVQGSGWRHEQTWPIESAIQKLFLSADSTLTELTPEAEFEVRYVGDPTVGVTAGLFDPAGTGLGMPMDQGPDDLRSATFTAPVQSADLVVVGTPRVRLAVTVEQGDDVNIVAKLCDVSPDGHSALVTTGWQKVAHWASDDHREPIGTGEPITLNVPLVSTAYRLQAGHRLRLSISCADFPRIWPGPSVPTIRITGGLGTSFIELPIAVGDGIAGPALPQPDSAIERNEFALESMPRYRIETDLAADTVSVVSGQLTALRTPNGDGRLAMDRTSRSIVSRSRPDGARVEGEAILTADLATGSTVVVEARSWVTTTGQVFTGHVSVDGVTIFDGDWRR